MRIKPIRRAKGELTGCVVSEGGNIAVNSLSCSKMRALGQPFFSALKSTFPMHRDVADWLKNLKFERSMAKERCKEDSTSSA